LKKKFLRYDAYAGKGIEEILSAEQLAKASVLTVNETQTCVFYNNDKDGFDMKPLPIRAQFSPVYSILVTDVNHDGINDLFLTGNFYGLKPEIGRYDANYGVTYLGDKKHGFEYLPPAQSGLFVTGEVRDAAVINTKNGKVILVARNNDALVLFKGN
jgi:enediyne biosynthesis protein E4